MKGPDRITLTLEAEGADAREIQASAELAGLLLRARRLNELADRPEEFDLSFSGVVCALLVSTDRYSALLREQAQRTPLNVKWLLDRKGVDAVRLAAAATEPPAEALRVDSRFTVTVSAANLLATAAKFAVAAGSGQVDVRHVLGTLLLEPGGHGGDLRQLGLDRRGWMRAFRGWIDKLDPEELEFWSARERDTFQRAEPFTARVNRVLVDAVQDVVRDATTQPATPPQRRTLSRWNRPTHDNDAVDDRVALERDRLGVLDDVQRFAKLLAAKDVKPPVAVGLFGAWGTGKSFFMGMLRSRVEELGATDSTGRYFARVAQITFNAWHYQDANLWASLALKIFEDLASELTAADTDSDVAAKRRALHEQLASSRRLRDEATRRREAADRARATVGRRLAVLEAERHAEARRVSLEKIARVTTKLRDDEQFGDDLALVRGLGRSLGVRPATRSGPAIATGPSEVDEPTAAQEMKAARASAPGLDNQLREAAALADHGRLAVVAAAMSVRDLRTAAAATGLAVALVGIVIGLQHIASALGWSGATAGILQLACVALPTAGAVLRRVRGVTAAIGAARRIRERVELEWVRPADSEEKDSLVATLSSLDAQIQADTLAVENAELSGREAAAELQRINAGGLVYDFLIERRQASTYRGALGLVSAVRHDLGTLRGLLEDFAQHGARPIGRIVLSIDDLDRCEPAKVVEVLQAVHLLLAFDLFNVVVGVDPRWLERSLERAFGDGTAESGASFSAQNYLEKIFQIPFSLPAMSARGFHQLVDELVLTGEELAERDATRADEVRSSPDKPASEGARHHGTHDGEGPPIDAEPASTPDAPVRNRDSPDGTDAREEVTTLFFEDFEQTFIQKLHGFVRTPRLAKRLVNIYRLLRVQASEEDLERFLSGPTTGWYRAALVLLAINVGFPRVGARLLDALSRGPKHALWRDFIAAEVKASGDPARSSASPARDALRAVELLAVGTELGNRDDSLEAYVHWAPRVRRYSFDGCVGQAVKPDDGSVESERGEVSAHGPPDARRPR